MIAPSATRRLTERLAETSALYEQPSAARPDVLTQHGREVLTLISSGLSTAEVTGRLFPSEGTVTAHVSKILAKLALRDRVQAFLLACETGPIRPGSKLTAPTLKISHAGTAAASRPPRIGPHRRSPALRRA